MAVSEILTSTIQGSRKRPAEVACAHPGAGLIGRCSTAIAPGGSGCGLADGGSDAVDAEANDTTTNDRLAMQKTKANAAQATLALDESGSNFSNCMASSSRLRADEWHGRMIR